MNVGPSLASQTYFARTGGARGENTSGNYCHISGGIAGILAPPIRLQD